MMAECRECPTIRWHCVVGEETRYDLPQPASLFGNWLMHPLSQFVLHPLERAPHTVAPCLPMNPEETRGVIFRKSGRNPEK